MWYGNGTMELPKAKIPVKEDMESEVDAGASDPAVEEPIDSAMDGL